MVDTHHHHRHHPHPDRSFDFFRNVNIQFLVHELKGPLDVIETNIRMLLEGQNNLGSLNLSQQKALRRSMRSAAKLRNIIYSLLEVGRSEAGHISLQRFNIVQCVTEVITDAFEAVTCKTLNVPEDITVLSNDLENNGIYLYVSPEVENVCLHQDKTKFMFILGNLIRNGLAHRKSKVMVQLMLKEGYLLIRVGDDGPGVKTECHDDLFRCYANNKKQQSPNRGKGHSLGLASSRILSRYLGGDVVLSDQFTGGAEFIVHLPLEFDDQDARKKGLDVSDSES